MEPQKNNPEKNNDHYIESDYLADMDKIVQTLTLRSMSDGNNGDFETAFSTMELAMWLSRSLDKKCLEAVLLNNMGLILTMKGAWDEALLTFDQSMELAMVSCPSHGNFFTILKNNIASLFDPKITTPGNPKDSGNPS